MVSKWACPDMFAYVLLLFLLRHMSHPPTILVSANLELGFLAFSLFCLNSTFSSLAVPLPALPSDTRVAPTKPWCLRCFGYCGMKVVSLLLAVGFLTGWFFGIIVPCMKLDLDINDLKIPSEIKTVLDGLHLASLVHAEVTLWSAAAATLGWISAGEIAMVMAFVLIAIFVILLPLLDVLVLLAIAVTHTPDSVVVRARGIRDDDKPHTSHWGMKVAEVLGHTEMLDVFIMGLCVIAAAGEAYRSDGIIISLSVGLWSLLGAEVLHYILYYMVSSVCEYNEDAVWK